MYVFFPQMLHLNVYYSFDLLTYIYLILKLKYLNLAVYIFFFILNLKHTIHFIIRLFLLKLKYSLLLPLEIFFI